MWLGSRSKLPQGDLGPLWHEFRAKNVHQEASNVGILMCDSIANKYIISNPILWFKYEPEHHKINKNKSTHLDLLETSFIIKSSNGSMIKMFKTTIITVEVKLF